MFWIIRGVYGLLILEWLGLKLRIQTVTLGCVAPETSLLSIMEKFWDANHEKLPQLQKVVKMLEGVDTSHGGRMIPEDQRPPVSLLSPSVPKKKGRLVGLGRRTRSVPPSSAPPPFVDPEVLTAQLKDKDDRISLLEIQMAAQQAGYEAQRRLNQQMMEMMQRMYPNEVFPDVPDP
ncbi:hypothetical protein DY000_02040602 [Brassica cretica]|uniref:Uncharacterized protein n=1 Tax=Brassica cretica TaxID=69181 RepID=A0ABQ7BKT9_BRACR|nr:hypothetical protein DY000_02040602 [Brassica cretica]